MIFVDSNLPMYLVGSFHQHKTDSLRLIEKCFTERERLVTDAEAFQEILHRYTAIHRRDIIQPAFTALLGIVDDVFSVDLEAIQQAKEIALGLPRLSARDALHVAVMKLRGIERILSFDAGFDEVPGITRLH